jgi:hypothetical protein
MISNRGLKMSLTYEQAWHKLEEWVEQEKQDMLVNPDRTDQYYSGIACQTIYIAGKMDELKKEME